MENINALQEDIDNFKRLYHAENYPNEFAENKDFLRINCRCAVRKYLIDLYFVIEKQNERR